MLTVDDIVDEYYRIAALGIGGGEFTKLAATHLTALGGIVTAVEHFAFYENESDPLRLAAGFLVYLSQRHPLPNANKRLAWFCALVLLAREGLTLDCTEQEQVTFVLHVVTLRYEIEDAVDWMATRLDVLE